jgi:hypothetical protein
MIKRVAGVVLILAMASFSFAVPFDNSAGGPAVATVGTGGDYATFSAAVAGFNAVTGDINRPWTMSILSNTTETTNPMMANTFGAGGSLTIKPAAGTQPTITFTIVGATATQPGFWAHFGIGVNDNYLTTAADTPGGYPVANATNNHRPSNNNYIIDGSNTVGGTTRDLTFYGNLASGINRLIGVVGDQDGVVIKNCNIIFQDTAGSAYAIRYATMNVTGLGPLVPDNNVLQNCFVNSRLGASALQFGIETGNAQGTMPAGEGIENLQLIDNHIVTRYRSVFMNPCKSFTFKGNLFENGDAIVTGGYLQTGIWMLNGVAGPAPSLAWVSNIEDNVTSFTNAGGTGTGFGTVVYDVSNSSGTLNVKNNIHLPQIHTLADPADGAYRVFHCNGAATQYNIEHNSVHVPEMPRVSGATLGAVAVVNAGNAFTDGGLLVRNNIFRFGETGTNAFAYRLASAANVVVNGNAISGGGKVGRVAATNYPTFADWQGAGYDVNGQDVDPTLTSPGAWDDSLHFVGGSPRPLLGVTPTVAVDIDGDARASYAYPGADEQYAAGLQVPVPVTVSGFAID